MPSENQKKQPETPFARFSGCLLLHQSENSLTRCHHIRRHNQFVKFFAGEQAQLDGGFAQGFVVFVGGFGDFGGVFVADFAVQR